MAMAEWKFLTNHALVLGWIARYPQSTAREMANAIGVTERTALKIVGELAAAGYIQRKRRGRRNVYRVNPELSLRHPVYESVSVGNLLSIIVPKKQSTKSRVAAAPMARVTRFERAASG